MIKREGVLFLVFFSLLVGSVLLAGCGEVVLDLSAYSCNNNGEFLLGGDALCLTDQGSPNNQVCCYKQDGSECESPEISLLSTSTANDWINEIAPSEDDYTAGEARRKFNENIQEIKDDLANNIEKTFNENCFSTYSYSVPIDDEGNTVSVSGMAPVCSPAYTIYLTQETGIEGEEPFLYVCYEGDWYRSSEMMDEDVDIDGDGVSLFWDCDESDPNMHSDMSMFNGFDEVFEICGDQKDNLCLGPYTHTITQTYSGISIDLDFIFDSEEEWSLEITDNCDENPVACETNCLFADNPCDYYGYADALAESEDGEITVPDGIGYCCGDESSDLATTIPEDGDVKSICLNKNYVSPEPTGCDDDWCWVDAQMDPYKIYTVNYLGDLGQESFDIMGNRANWYVCSKSNEGPIVGGNINPEYNEIENRFYCYDEGDHYSLAECSDPAGDSVTQYNEGSVKHRTAAAGAFALPIAESGDTNFYYVDFREDEQPTVYENFPSYQEIYSINDNMLAQTIDFIGYDYLEFLVQYTGDSIFLPDNLEMIIYGMPTDINAEDEETIYFSQNILGYTVNEPLLEPDHIIHVRVPVADWPDIKAISIQTNGDRNTIQVLAMYLTKESDINSDTVPICSGKDSSNYNNWLTDIDDSTTDSEADGTLICDFRYGGNAWLGDSFGFEVDEANDQASCCGDDEGEFYAGKSANEYGCFNGIPIADEDTAMQIEFNVEYSTQEYEVSYPETTYFVEWPEAYINLGSEGEIEWECGYLPSDINNEIDCQEIHDEIDGDQCTCSDITLECQFTTDPDNICEEHYQWECENVDENGDYDDTVYGTSSFELTCDETSDFDYEYIGEVESLEEIDLNQVGFFDGSYYYLQTRTVELDSPYTITYDESPKVIHTETIYLEDYTEDFTLELEANEVILEEFQSLSVDTDNVYFFTPFNQEHHDKEITLSQTADFPTEFELWIVAETDKINVSTIEDSDRDKQDLSYTCLNEECIYALPGSPPYEITNEHEELYDLYFVSDDNGIPKDTLITSEGQEFEELGVIKATAISQQILYDFDYDEETGGFYGCNAAYYITEEITNAGENLEENGFCAIQGNYYCAHQDSNRLVNSWSLDSITEIAYEPVDEWDEDTELILQAVSYASTERNHSTSVVPQRNFIPNADFEASDGDDIDYWQLLDGSGAIIENEKAELDDGVMEIDSTYTFISENIAIQTYKTYSYTDNSDCYVSLTLIDKDGTSDPVLVPESFESQGHSFLKIEVSGSCDYQEPMLQLTDDLGAGEYEYNDDYPTRQGAACCPEDMCWNGYVCSANMAEYTYMTEEPQENQTYRCINGEWSYLEPQYDWNGEEIGFCETEDQCFVTSSLSEGAEYGAELTDFYDGTYPLCINDGEYLLDHYCENGNWSSRTKFLATKLLSFAETDDFILYCAPFREALPDFAVDGYNYENYLAGEVSATIEEADDLAAELTGETEAGSTIEVCFDALENSETGRRLVDQEDNTCINAVCVLQYKSSNTFEAAFATSMNHNITSDESFLIPLGVAQAELEDYCVSDNTTNFIECDEALWFNDEINSVIYAKEGISFDPSLIDSIINWFLGLFGGDVIEESEDFINDAQNFNTLYLLSKEGFVVRAVQEINADQETLIAEYENFDLPICDYINGVNEDYTMVEQWPAQPEVLVNCELTEEGVYRIMTATNTDYWWPQLTSKLRVAMD